MNAASLLAELEERSVFLLSLGDNLLIDAPQGALTSDLRSAIAANKAGLLRELGRRPPVPPKSDKRASPLAEYAADRAPAVRFTIRETDDVVGDVRLLSRVREVIPAHQPGGNHSFLTIRTLDGRRVTVEWRALALRSLRLGIARVLAQAHRGRASNNATR